MSEVALESLRRSLAAARAMAASLRAEWANEKRFDLMGDMSEMELRLSDEVARVDSLAIAVAARKATSDE